VTHPFRSFGIRWGARFPMDAEAPCDPPDLGSDAQTAGASTGIPPSEVLPGVIFYR